MASGCLRAFPNLNPAHIDLVTLTIDTFIGDGKRPLTRHLIFSITDTQAVV